MRTPTHWPEKSPRIPVKGAEKPATQSVPRLARRSVTVLFETDSFQIQKDEIGFIVTSGHKSWYYPNLKDAALMTANEIGKNKAKDLLSFIEQYDKVSNRLIKALTPNLKAKSETPVELSEDMKSSGYR